MSLTSILTESEHNSFFCLSENIISDEKAARSSHRRGKLERVFHNCVMEGYVHWSASTML